MFLDINKPSRRVMIPKGNDTYALRMWMRRAGARFKGGYWEFPLECRMLAKFIHDAEKKCAVVDLSPELDKWLKLEGHRQRVLERIRKGEHVTEAGLGWERDPYEHQRGGTSWLYLSDWTMLLDDMGLGKTYQSIVAACSLFAAGLVQDRKCIIVCPNSLKDNWVDEIATFGWGDCMVLNPTGSTRDRSSSIEDWNRQRDYPGSRWLILNYESLRWFMEAFHNAARGGILVCDEAHRLKNGRAKVTKIIEESCPARLWLMTGTPVANKPEDLWSLMNIVRPGLAGFYFYDFEKRHIKRNKFNAIYGYKKLDELTDQLSIVSLGRKKEDCLDLPEKIFEKRSVELSVSERRAYDRMHKDLITWLDDDVSDPPTMSQAAEFTTRFIRLRQIADGLVSAGAGGKQSWSKETTKLKEAVQVYKDSGERRCVIWFQFVDVLEKAMEMFPRDRTGAIYGKVAPAARKSEIDQWRARDGSVLLCQMDTAGEGLNLHAADLQIFTDLPTTPRQRAQCIDRLHRIGQKRHVTIVDIVARNTVDVGILRKLQAKQDLAGAIESKSYGRDEWRELLGG